ncbi:MAG: twin-arginine translocase TatA/TatE family subunit [Leptolyngbya sp. SIO3F4]|nr:twin-arginine translocase TatA/TatE family subunit [Leptolyngbya sp. SIO3F4]
MFGLGWPEVGIIAIVAVLIFGPKKIPELGSALGKTLRGFKDEMDAEATADFEDADYIEDPEQS